MNAYRGQGPQHFRGCGGSRSNFQNNAGTYQYQYYTHDQQSEQYGPPPHAVCVEDLTIPPNTVIRVNTTSTTLWKR